MQLLKNHAYIQGFEDYNIVALGDGCLLPNTWGFYIPRCFDRNTGAYIINKDLPTKAYTKEHPLYSCIQIVEFEQELVTNHKELLDTAKKVYTHPSCKLSRSMMAEKYKKSLNPYLSDAIIIPEPNFSEFRLNKVALFINDKSKVIVSIEIKEEDAIKRIQSVKEGDKFRDVITCQPNDSYSNHKPYTTSDILEAEFFYYGELLFVPNSHSWAMDVLTYAIPADKIVFEESVQESLSSETNQLDFDSLCSIKDMLESSDENTVSAGLKSLSMMDWMHYPQSIKFILSNTKDKNRWIYNKASNSTSVKYMIKTIAGNSAYRRSWWPGGYDNEIYEEDFELFKKLKCHYNHIQPDQILNDIRYIEFMTVDANGFLTPNFKARV